MKWFGDKLGEWEGFAPFENISLGVKLPDLGPYLAHEEPSCCNTTVKYQGKFQSLPSKEIVITSSYCR